MESRIPVLPIYQKAFDSDKRYIALIGGAAAGRSYATASHIINSVMNSDGRKKVVVLRKYKEDHRESTFRSIQQLIEGYDGFAVLKSDMRVAYNANKSNIYFLGAEDICRIPMLGHIDLVWVEEASGFSNEDFDDIAKKIKAQVILTGNPVGEALIRFADGNENTEFLKTTYKDNPYAAPEHAEILERFKSTSEYYYKAYCLGEFAKPTKERR